MSLREIKQAIEKLNSAEFQQFAEWFEAHSEHQAELWDRQIEADSKAGRLDALFAEADCEFEAGNCKAL